MADYVSYLRKMIGNSKVILNCSACIILNSEGDILLQKRGDSNKWGLPGGVMELGESAEECVIREVEEETGLTVEIDYFQGVYSKYFAAYKNGDKAQAVVCVFVTHHTSGELKCDGVETVDLAYFDKENLPEIFCCQHQDIIKDFIDGKRCVYR